MLSPPDSADLSVLYTMILILERIEVSEKRDSHRAAEFDDKISAQNYPKLIITYQA